MASIENKTMHEYTPPSHGLPPSDLLEAIGRISPTALANRPQLLAILSDPCQHSSLNTVDPQLLDEIATLAHEYGELVESGGGEHAALQGMIVESLWAFIAGGVTQPDTNVLATLVKGAGRLRLTGVVRDVWVCVERTDQHPSDGFLARMARTVGAWRTRGLEDLVLNVWEAVDRGRVGLEGYVWVKGLEAAIRGPNPQRTVLELWRYASRGFDGRLPLDVLDAFARASKTFDLTIDLDELIDRWGDEAATCYPQDLVSVLEVEGSTVQEHHIERLARLIVSRYERSAIALEPDWWRKCAKAAVMGGRLPILTYAYDRLSPHEVSGEAELVGILVNVARRCPDALSLVGTVNAGHCQESSSGELKRGSEFGADKEAPSVSELEFTRYRSWSLLARGRPEAASEMAQQEGLVLWPGYVTLVEGLADLQVGRCRRAFDTLRPLVEKEQDPDVAIRAMVGLATAAWLLDERVLWKLAQKLFESLQARLRAEDETVRASLHRLKLAKLVLVGRALNGVKYSRDVRSRVRAGRESKVVLELNVVIPALREFYGWKTADTVLLSLLASAYRRIGAIEPALATLRECWHAHKDARNRAVVLIELGRTFTGDGRHDEAALASLASAVVSTDSSARLSSLMLASAALRRSGDYDGALAVLRLMTEFGDERENLTLTQRAHSHWARYCDPDGEGNEVDVTEAFRLYGELYAVAENELDRTVAVRGMSAMSDHPAVGPRIRAILSPLTPAGADLLAALALRGTFDDDTVVCLLENPTESLLAADRVEAVASYVAGYIAHLYVHRDPDETRGLVHRMSLRLCEHSDDPELWSRIWGCAVQQVAFEIRRRLNNYVGEELTPVVGTDDLTAFVRDQALPALRRFVSTRLAEILPRGYWGRDSPVDLIEAVRQTLSLRVLSGAWSLKYVWAVLDRSITVQSPDEPRLASGWNAHILEFLLLRLFTSLDAAMANGLSVTSIQVHVRSADDCQQVIVKCTSDADTAALHVSLRGIDGIADLLKLSERAFPHSAQLVARADRGDVLLIIPVWRGIADASSARSVMSTAAVGGKKPWTKASKETARREALEWLSNSPRDHASLERALWAHLDGIAASQLTSSIARVDDVRIPHIVKNALELYERASDHEMSDRDVESFLGELRRQVSAIAFYRDGSIDVSVLVKEACEDLQRRHEDIAFVYDLARPGQAVVRGKRPLLRLAITDIVHNAFREVKSSDDLEKVVVAVVSVSDTEPGGEVTIRLRNPTKRGVGDGARREGHGSRAIRRAVRQFRGRYYRHVIFRDTPVPARYYEWTLMLPLG